VATLDGRSQFATDYAGTHRLALKTAPFAGQAGRGQLPGGRLERVDIRLEAFPREIPAQCLPSIASSVLLACVGGPVHEPAAGRLARAIPSSTRTSGPRATDPRSAATALRATVAISRLRALLQSATTQPPGLVADEASRRNGSPHLSRGADRSAHAEHETGAPPGEIPLAPRRRPWRAFWRRR
jgi:hypothetical protein